MRTLFAVRNSTGESWPAYGMARIGDVLGRDGANEDIPLYELLKPDGEDGIYIVNGAAPLLQGNEGTGVYYFNSRYVAVDEAKNYEIGDTIGAVDNQWEAGDNGGHKDHFNVVDVKNDDDIIPVVSIATSSTTTTPTTGNGNCPCTCIEDGDIEVDGKITSSQWSILVPATTFSSQFGTITFVGGSHVIVYNSGSGTWALDVGDYLIAAYSDGSDATEDTTMDGVLTMTWGTSEATVTLCITGEVPEPAP